MSFFPVNNVLYYLVVGQLDEMYIISLPDSPRFFHIADATQDYVIFVDDILKVFLPTVPQSAGSYAVYTFKVTRDADLLIDESLDVDIATALERELAKRILALLPGYYTKLIFLQKV